MIRHTLLPHARFGLALGLLAMVALSPPAWSQDRSVDDRLDRLERDLNMLQRQVYRQGAPADSADSADSGGGNPGAAVNLDIRMDRLEQQMRELTGRLEEYSNSVTQLRQRLEQINSDIDVRFNQLQGGSGAASPPPPVAKARGGGAGNAPVADQDSDGEPEPADAGGADSGGPGVGPGGGGLTPPTSLMPPGTAVPGPGAPQAIFNTLTPPGEGPPPGQAPGPQVATAESGGGLSQPGTLPGGSPSEQYNYAFGLLKQADYPAAEAALQAFVAHHPSDPMASNAQYFLGETFYTRGQFSEAASAFAEGFKRYPKSARAPNDLLMLGMSLSRNRQKQNACLALDQLDQGFPKAVRLRARAAAERRHLGCPS